MSHKSDPPPLGLGLFCCQNCSLEETSEESKLMIYPLEGNLVLIILVIRSLNCWLILQRSSRNHTDGPPAAAKRSRSTGRTSEKVCVLIKKCKQDIGILIGLYRIVLPPHHKQLFLIYYHLYMTKTLTWNVE